MAVSGANSNLYRIYQGFGGITQVENSTNSNYNSFQAGLRMQNRRGLTLQLSYTYGHEIDIQSGDLGSTNQQGSGGLLSNPFNTRYDRGSGVIDRRNVFNANYIYHFASFEDRGSAMRLLLGGWTFSGVTVAQSGNPVNVTYSPDTLGLGGGTTNRPNFDPSSRKYPKKQLAWFNTGAYSAPTAPWDGGSNQGYGTAGKDSIVGPGLFNWNLSMFKDFRITAGEGPRIQLRFESYNTFNHTVQRNRHRIYRRKLWTGDFHTGSAHLAIWRQIHVLEVGHSERSEANASLRFFFATNPPVYLPDAAPIPAKRNTRTICRPEDPARRRPTTSI